MALGRGLRLGGLRLEPEEGEEVGDRVVGGVGEVSRVHAVEVVDEVAQQHQEKGSQEHLHGVRSSVKVPHTRRRAEAHGEVEPERHARSRGKKGATVPGVSDSPLAIGVLEVVAEHHRVPPSAQARRTRSTMSPRKWWVGTSDAPMVALWPDRRQSSPRRSFNSPFSSTWQMAKERAAKQSPVGGWRRTPMSATEGRATVETDQWSGACDPAQASLRHQLVEKRSGVLLVPGLAAFLAT